MAVYRIQLATPAGLENNPPLVRNFVKLLTVRVGELLNYTLPDDTFYDVEDGYTRRLRLNLVDDNGLPLPSGFWLKFLPATGVHYLCTNFILINFQDNICMRLVLGDKPWSMLLLCNKKFVCVTVTVRGGHKIFSTNFNLCLKFQNQTFCTFQQQAKILIKLFIRGCVQILLALPLEQQIGRHSFLLQATDNQGQMGVERVRLRVLPSRRAFAERKPTYESTVRLDADFSAFLLDIEQPISILQSISVKLYSNANASALMMTQPLREGSVILSWANTTIPTDICDSAALRSLHSKIVMADGTKLTPEFVAALAPFRILSYSSLVQGPCATDKTLVSQLTTNLANNIPPPPVNNRPVLTRPLGTINLTVGRVLNLSIPANTFHDHENGDTRHLRLVFLSKQPITGDHWVRLDERTQTLYGLPVHAGQYEFTLVANDAGDLTARDTIIFNVAERQTLVNHEFQLQLEHFAPTTPTDNLSRTLDIIQRIASLYGDVDAGKITVTRLTVTANITTLVWTNHSVPVPTDTCPVKLLSHLMSFLFGPKDSIAEELKNEFEPHYIRLVSADPLGPCNNQGVQPEAPPTSNPRDPAIPELHNEDNSNSGASQSAESAVMTAAVPLAIIVVVVIIVVFVACFVYARSKRKGKLVVQRKTGQKLLAKPGVPVVFVDEICERPESPTKPLLLEREQPPLSPPPQYGQSRESRTGGSSNNGTLHSECCALLEDSAHVPANKQR